MVHFKSVVRVALLAVGSLSAVSGFLTPSPLGVRLQSSSSRAHARSSVSSLSMKVFDWKKRAALAADPSLADFKVGEENILGKLAPAPGSRRPKTRKGRGIAAGQGATCGFGMRGQKSRAGRPTRPGFEGGQMPLYRRLPKLVGKGIGRDGHQKQNYGLLKISVLNKCEPNSEVSYETCLEKGLMTKLRIKKGTSFIRGKQLVKVIGSDKPAGEGPDQLAVNGLTVKAHAFTASAVRQIEEKGGKCILLNPVTNEEIKM